MFKKCSGRAGRITIILMVSECDSTVVLCSTLLLYDIHGV